MATHKGLSKGTLSLRFMQNSQRTSKSQVELDKAEVKDDGEWEVGQDVRETWGVGQSESGPQITYEASYLPFVFRSQSPPNAENTKTELGTEADVVLPKGRRRFKLGLEVQSDQDKPRAGETSQPSQTNSQAKLTRLKSISGSSAAHGKAPKSPKASATTGKTTKQGIFDTSGTGTDLRARNIAYPTRGKQEGTTAPPGFMRPIGVDAPMEGQRPQSELPSSPNTGSAAQTEHAVARIPTIKREIEVTEEQPADEGKKRKKKKQRVSIGE
ncbi:hypothetical protein PLEOSDRAFT_1114188 [Pleurotus ostreatus PC15]|uniref:Uncharacterized protein n=1 Tax=Pleurotus ostreatus (strain PC15) TaxID=1137138 RepID=A0A067NK62_PLEO1|nr:hypothetical protein PLEOSDRAFT_1114188 [Pleurotus ostreatus PC15]